MNEHLRSAVRGLAKHGLPEAWEASLKYCAKIGNIRQRTWAAGINHEPWYTHYDPAIIVTIGPSALHVNTMRPIRLNFKRILTMTTTGGLHYAAKMLSQSFSEPTITMIGRVRVGVIPYLFRVSTCPTSLPGRVASSISYRVLMSERVHL